MCYLCVYFRIFIFFLIIFSFSITDCMFSGSIFFICVNDGLEKKNTYSVIYSSLLRIFDILQRIRKVQKTYIPCKNRKVDTDNQN